MLLLVLLEYFISVLGETLKFYIIITNTRGDISKRYICIPFRKYMQKNNNHRLFIIWKLHSALFKSFDFPDSYTGDSIDTDDEKDPLFRDHTGLHDCPDSFSGYAQEVEDYSVGRLQLQCYLEFFGQ